MDKHTSGTGKVDELMMPGTCRDGYPCNNLATGSSRGKAILFAKRFNPLCPWNEMDPHKPPQE